MSLFLILALPALLLQLSGAAAGAAVSIQEWKSGGERREYCTTAIAMLGFLYTAGLIIALLIRLH